MRVIELPAGGCRWCWPGSSYYFDSLSPDARKWWEEQFQLTKWQGSTTSVYLWNDMNEPSVFNGPEVMLDTIASKSHHRCWTEPDAVAQSRQSF